MAIKEFWVGSVGPFLYDDGETYPDSMDRVAFRGAQVYLDEAPIEDMHVMRKEDTEAYVVAYVTTYFQTALSDIVSHDDDAVFYDDNVVYNQ